jgi:hypothetical protein
MGKCGPAINRAEAIMSLVIQRKQTSQAIAELWHNNFFNHHWRMIGTFLGRGKEASIRISAAALMAANWFLGVSLSVLLGETRFTTPSLILTNLMWVTYTYLVILLSLGIYSRMLEFLRLRLIELMKTEQHIQELQAWTEQWVGRRFQQVLFSVGFAALLASVNVYAIYRTTRLSIGVTQIYFINFFYLGATVYGLISLIAFLIRLRHWSLTLYPDDPASSPILLQLSEQLRDYLLIYSLAIALFMVLTGFVGALNTITVAEFLIFNWIPILTLFFLAHLTFSSMIMRVKQERMGVIQSRIMKLSNLDKTDAKTTAQIMSLMDYHDRVKAAKNSLINSQAILNLLGSLAFPSLALLIDAWPYVKDLFT